MQKGFCFAIAAIFVFFAGQGLIAQGPGPSAPWIRYSKTEANQRWYHENFVKALRRVVLDANDRKRLGTAMSSGPLGVVPRDQVLDEYDILSFKDFVTRIHIDVRVKLDVWLAAEEKAKAKKIDWKIVQRLKREYLDSKLTVSELVVMYDFYRSIERSPESLFQNKNPLHRIDVALARKVKAVTNLPTTPRRTHGKNLSKNPPDLEAWREVYEMFHDAKMTAIFDELWSQIVGIEAGSGGTRHIIGFEDAFIFRCQEISKKDPYRAITLLMAYLTNRSSSLAILGGNAEQSATGVTKLQQYLRELRNRRQAERFFQGDWPEDLLPKEEGERTESGWRLVPKRIHRVLTEGPETEAQYKFRKPKACDANLAAAKSLKN